MTLREKQVLDIYRSAYSEAYEKSRLAGLSEDDSKWAAIDAAQAATKQAGLDRTSPKA